MPALRYLTVQDILWINTQVTGTPQPFRYEDLEEATFYQYGYGSSSGPLAQAASLLSGFLKRRPLEQGNEATAFLAFATFLRINGFELDLDDRSALAWIRANSEACSPEAVQRVVREVASHEELGVQEAFAEVMECFLETIHGLGGKAGAAA